MAEGRKGGTPEGACVHGPPAWELLLDSAPRPGAEHMALDAALLDEADRSGRAVLRLYRWAPPCLSFGRNEAALARYDRGAIERLGLDVVRRPTGGRAVWHEHEVTYAVAAPIAAFGSLREAYFEIHSRLAAALRALGIEATLAEPPDRRFTDRRLSDRHAACFATAVGGEVLAAGRKVIGSAQVRQGGAFLQHGSILLDGSQDIIAAVSRQPTALSGATTVAAALGRPVTFDEVTAAIAGGWGISRRLTAVPSFRLSLYGDPAWTWRR